MMEILQLYNGLPKARQLRQVTSALENGELAIIPTDTNYSAVCSINSKKGINRLYAINSGKSEKKITLFCADLKDISLYATVSNPAYRMMKSLVPGPYTFILPASRMVPKMVLTKRRTVGIRTPDHPVCQELPRELGTALLGLSVKNAAGSENMIAELEIVSDSSTILDFTGDECVVLRKGKGPI